MNTTFFILFFLEPLKFDSYQGLQHLLQWRDRYLIACLVYIKVVRVELLKA